MVKQRIAGALVLGLVLAVFAALRQTPMVDARGMYHPCDIGEGQILNDGPLHDEDCGAHTPTPRPPTAAPTAAPTDPPANFRVTGVGASSVTLQWGRLRSHHGITSAHISVYRQPEGSQFGEYTYIGRYSASRSGGSLRVSNLKSDTLYQFFLLYNTRRGLGMGGMLLVRTQTDPNRPTPTPTPTPLPKPTDAPVNFSVTSVGATGITLQWGAAPRNRGITSAEIVRYEHNGSEYRYSGVYGAHIPGPGRVAIFGAIGLKPDTRYRFTLHFLDVDGDIVMSRSVTARTLAAQTTLTPTPTSTLLAAQATPTPTPLTTPTDAPVNFSVTGVGRDSISLQWGAAPRNRGIVSGVIEAHEYLEDQSRYQYIRRDSAGISAGNLLVPHLKSDTLYKFILIYRNSDYDVVMRPVVTARTQTGVATPVTPTQTPTPTPVTFPLPTATAGRSQVVPTPTATADRSRLAPALTATASGTSAVELSWTAVNFAVRYELWTWDSASDWQQLDDGNLTGTSYTHGSLTPGTTYYYTVRAVDANGVPGPWSEYASATPSSASPASLLPAPALKAEAGEYAVELSWAPVPGAVRYELWAWDSASGWQQLDDGNLTGASYTHSGLTAGRKYYYTIRAVNAAGEPGPWQQNYASATASAPTVQ